MKKQFEHKKTCLVIGNGPSANETLDNDIPSDIDLICLNNFVISEQYTELKPKFYILLDPVFIDERYAVANEILNNIVLKTNWTLILLVPISFKKSNYFNQLIGSNINLKVSYFNYTIVDGFDFLNRLFYKTGLGMLQSQNVLVASVFQAISIGYEKIYITGADHSWHENIKISNETNDLLLNDTHFYGQKNINFTEKFVPKSVKIESQLAKQFLNLYKVFLGHQKLAVYAQILGIEIINISKHSNIDVYKRGKLFV